LYLPQIAVNFRPYHTLGPAMDFSRSFIFAGLALVIGSAAYAQAVTTPPVVTGSPSVSVEGQPAARAGDSTGSGGTVIEGSSNVFIGGRPAVRVGDRTDCGVVVRGSKNVFVNGKPMARAGDPTVCAP
jgi:uncharacterized Zn-binding protein involved in type VI secretion